VKLKIPGKIFLKSGQKRCFSHFFHGSVLAKSQPLPLVKNYNLNVTEVRHPDLKNSFLGIFNFTVGILHG